MTDITKYKNVSLSHKTYEAIDVLRKKNSSQYSTKSFSNYKYFSERESEEAKWKSKKRLKK